MPKAILEFNIPEDQHEFDLAVNAGKYSAFLWHLENNVFRTNIKYGPSAELMRQIELSVEKTNEFTAKFNKDSGKPLEVPSEDAVLIVLEVLRDIYYESKNGSGIIEE